MGKKFLFTLCAIGFGLLFSTLSIQAMVISIDIRELTQSAEDIIVGKVLSKRCSWNENRTQINTYLTLGVKKNLTGELINDTIVVKHPGGRVGRMGLTYPYAPSFRELEEVLLFLTSGEEPGTRVIVGDTQGKFSIREASSGKMVIWEGKEVSLTRFEGMIKRILIGQRRIKE